MSKLDDLLGKKKEVIPVLDLSRTVAHTKEEYKRLLEKVPDYKMRPIKVRTEEIKIKDKDWNFKVLKKESRHLLKQNGERDKFYVYLDPIPIEMRQLVIMELCPVPIDWKMLTTLRPKTKLEEEYYSKLIELGKLQLKTETKDKRETTLNAPVRKVKNKSGIIETRIFTCTECSEEFCNGRTCCDFNYDLYTRIVPKSAVSTLKQKQGQHGGGGTSGGAINTSNSENKKSGGGRHKKTNKISTKKPKNKNILGKKQNDS